MNTSPEFLFNIAGILVGAVAAYFGAVNAMRERLAKLEARADANSIAARDAYVHAQGAHIRIDNTLDRK